MTALNLLAFHSPQSSSLSGTTGTGRRTNTIVAVAGHKRTRAEAEKARAEGCSEQHLKVALAMQNHQYFLEEESFHTKPFSGSFCLLLEDVFHVMNVEMGAS